jgi:hypothetical protein
VCMVTKREVNVNIGPWTFSLFYHIACFILEGGGCLFTNDDTVVVDYGFDEKF